MHSYTCINMCIYIYTFFDYHHFKQSFPPLRGAHRSSTEPHIWFRPTGSRPGSGRKFGRFLRPTLGKADKHVANRGDAIIRSIWAHLLAPTPALGICLRDRWKLK